MSEPIHYVVVCDHPEESRHYFVADLDDYRPVGGGINVQLFSGGIGTLVTPINKHGSRRRIPFKCACETCPLHVSIDEATTLPELLDRIRPVREQVFASDTEVVEVPPDMSMDQIYDVIFNGAEIGPGTVVGQVTRSVIPLKAFCDIVGQLRARGRR